MAQYTGSLVLYQSFNKNKSNGVIDLDDTTAGRFKVALLKSSYTPSASAHTVLADVNTGANEISATGGYARQSMAGITWTQSGAIMTFDANDVAFTASGANFDAARYWLLFDSLSVGITNALIAYGLIDATPADVTVINGTTLTLRWNVSGLFTDTIS